MTTIAFEGGLGSGKTLGMTFFLFMEKLVMLKKVYANYWLDIQYTPLDMSEVLAEMADLKNVAIGIDEFHIFCDSRIAASKRNRLISYFALQTRKRNVALYFTTQFLDQVDKRLRRLVDYRIVCEALGNNWFHYTLYDLTQLKPKEKVFMLKGDAIYDHYSTDEIIGII
jgi:hypothetical protein